jgi:hypothetical protein
MMCFARSKSVDRIVLASSQRLYLLRLRYWNARKIADHVSVVPADKGSRTNTF